jgi:hypothetical protein
MRATRWGKTMTRYLAVLACWYFAGAALAQKSNTAGHISDAGKYSVVFPVKPSKLDADKSIATAAGNLTVFTSKAEASGVVYSVTYTEYPESFSDVQPGRLLDGVTNGMKGTDGQVTGGLPLDVPGGEGRQFTITAAGNYVRVKLYLVGRRLYLVQASGKAEATKSRAADEFLNSFTLLK